MNYSFLPQVYQIEVFSRCNLKCPFCPTGIAHEPPNYASSAIDVELFKTIVERDLGNTQFVELQMRGEPTLHKELNTFINLVKQQNILVGFSTHGGTLQLPRNMTAALSVDYLTISIDAGTEEGYNSKRVGGQWSVLVDNIDRLIKLKHQLKRSVMIDLQLIEESFTDSTWQDELYYLKHLAHQHQWTPDVTIRHLPNSNPQWMNPTHQHYPMLCLNPWFSVSIKCDGSVVPCCMAFKDEPDMVYGNVAEQSLTEIWMGDKVHEFRMKQLDYALTKSTKTSNIPHTCATCSNKSPALFHNDLIVNALKQIKG